VKTQPLHPSDGSDPMGTYLSLTIRIGPDGKLYFHDITADLLPVALALCPHNEELKQRHAVAAAFEDKERP
jgi:hypothetical protein